MNYMRVKNFLPLLLILVSSSLMAVSGMFPVNMIDELPLKEAGFNVDANFLFNSDSVSLVDGIVRVGGCSGAFISSEGLILTNHHCAFQAIQDNSTPDRDLLADGFVSANRNDERPAPGYTVRITEKYEDVSDSVLSVISPGMDYQERTSAIEVRIHELEKRAEQQNPGLRADISEMFLGKSYVMFYYTFIRDVRLVYAPPRSIGNFGGEVDNWSWPRHTGDFSLMRAYVAIDGSSASYAADNVPYHPKHVIPVNPEGVDEDDLVFILGYPGQTFRHRSSHFIDYRENTVMPKIIDWYQWQINLYEKISESDVETSIKLQSRIKGLANVEKKYRGQLLGMSKLQLLEDKINREKQLADKIISDSLRSEYLRIEAELGQFYSERRDNYPLDFIVLQLRYGSELFDMAVNIYEASIERAKPDNERKRNYLDKNWSDTKKNWLADLSRIVKPADEEVLKALILQSWMLPEEKRIEVFEQFRKGRHPEKYLAKQLKRIFNDTRLDQPDYFENLLDMNEDQIKRADDPLLQLAVKIYPVIKARDDREKGMSGREDVLYGQLIDILKTVLPDDFVPDANSTLRLTYGYVEGYSPVDGMETLPFTTLQGIVQKNTGIDPFNAPDRLLTKINEMADSQLSNVPVCFMYSLDTTGGNSGSAVLNSRGELIGLNFDRTFDATINDYRWDLRISRSIGVDIRYILWVISEYSGANHLIQEIIPD